MANQNDAKIWARAVTLVVIVSILAIGAVAWVLPDVVIALNAGVSIKDAAKYAFILTVVTLIIFAIAAGDGLLGELQFMLGGFLGFFVLNWVLIAWIF